MATLTETEKAVVEAAIDLTDLESAYDAGVPVGQHIERARQNLRKAVADLHSEHDGRYTL